jgi:ABC-2 type transport system permease protein
VKVLALAYKELRDILSEKIYIFGFFLQLFIVMGIVLIGFSYSYIAGIEEKASVTTDDPDFARFMRGDEQAYCSYSRSFFGDAYVENRETAFYIYTDDDYYFDMLRPKVEQYYYRETDALRSPLIKREFIREKRIIPEFIEIMYSLLVPIVILLPVFLSMNILSDSIVGEKERKTFEILLASPLTRLEIIIGKLIPVISLGFLQVTLWLFVISRRNISIGNIGALYLFLFILMVLFFSISVIFSMISSNIREANLYLTLFMMFLTFLMFVPFPSLGGFDAVVTYSPVVAMVKITTNVLERSILPYFVLYTAFAGIALFIAKSILERDEGLRL